MRPVVELGNHPACKDRSAQLVHPGNDTHGCRQVLWAVYRTSLGYVVIFSHRWALAGYFGTLEAAKSAYYDHAELVWGKVAS